METLTRQEARRIAVRAQLLEADRPGDLLEAVRHLTLLQLEPTAAVAPSAYVVAWSRVGAGFHDAMLDDLVADGSLIELEQRLRPAEDLALYRAEMAAWPGTGVREDHRGQLVGWIEANDHTRRDILDKLHDQGPCTRAEFPDTTVVPWQSSGWNDNRNIRRLLDMMVRRGEVAVVGYEGRDKLWDLAERVYPDDPVPPLDEAIRLRAQRQLASLGIARARVAAAPSDPSDVGPVGLEARVEGARGTWRVDPDTLTAREGIEPRAAILSPLDRLVFDRVRMEQLFDFDYQLEMYKPVAARRWGYWAMPVLHGDELVGKLDATADRDAGVLRVDAVHEDRRWSRGVRAEVDEEIELLAAWLGLVLQRP